MIYPSSFFSSVGFTCNQQNSAKWWFIWIYEYRSWDHFQKSLFLIFFPTESFIWVNVIWPQGLNCSTPFHTYHWCLYSLMIAHLRWWKIIMFEKKRASKEQEKNGIFERTLLEIPIVATETCIHWTMTRTISIFHCNFSFV